MRIRMLFSLAILAIAVLLAAGCTGSSGASTPVPTTSAPAVSAPANMLTPGTPATTATASPAWTRLTTATTTPAPDPILHRWVREYPTFTTDMPWAAYDFVFLSGGSVTYTYGVPIKSGSNIRIVAQQKMTGTWEKIGDDTYRVVLPATSTSSQIYRVYTRVPASTDKDTGTTVNEHIESSYETGSLPTGRDKLANEMYYPERADS